jgi:hypothetical protein
MPWRQGGRVVHGNQHRQERSPQDIATGWVALA